MYFLLFIVEGRCETFFKGFPTVSIYSITDIDRYILTNYNDAYCCAVAMQDLPLIFIYR